VYPISITGAKYFDTDQISDFNKNFIVKLSEKLMLREFSVNVHSMESGSFQGVYFRFAWRPPNFLNMVTKGSFSISEHKSGFIKIKFRLVFTEFFYYCLAFTSIPLIFYNYWQVLIGGLLVVWLLFLGGTFLLAQMQFDTLLSSIYKELKPKKKVAKK